MSSRNLEYLLAPCSVALIGASDRPGSVGVKVMRNLLEGGFDGSIWPVNLRHSMVAGKRAFAHVRDLPAAPDLAVVCTPAAAVPGVIHELGEKGTRAAVVITAGLEAQAKGGGTLATAMLEAARPYKLRILGANSLGLLLPRIGLNASFAHAQALPGNLAFIAQSGALATALLDWTRMAQIGFSALVSLGTCSDVDFGDLLDYLSHDPHTRAILLYVEAITGARKFMSAARAAARNKPVIVVKAGRHAVGAKRAASYASALAGSDAVYDAAFRRAGMLRVATTRELFDAAETLARLKPLTGERLVILSNGGSPGVLATDALIDGEGELASLGEATLDALDEVVPPKGSRGNPVDLLRDASSGRYVDALGAVLADPGVDAALLIHAPTALVSAATIAQTTKSVIDSSQKPVLTCWMGGEAAREARVISSQAGVPTYSTPEESVDAFLQAVRYHRNQRQLMEVPSSIPETFVPQTDVVKSVIGAALAQGRNALSEREAKQVLSAYCIPVAKNVEVNRSSARELIVGITTDPTFGPVVLFGRGGVHAEVLPDTAIGLPPLNTVLAAELISRTRAKKLLGEVRHVPRVDFRALELTLVQVSQLAVDIPEIVELEINPLLADAEGVLALNARIQIAPASKRVGERLAIRPYPRELEEHFEFDGRDILLRPLRPEDAPAHREFLRHISDVDMHSRFFRAVKELPDSDLAYLTQIDYERAMAFIAVGEDDTGQRVTLGVVRAQADADNEYAEFAVLVRSDLKGHGLGSRLMEKIIQYCRHRGIRVLIGDVLASNTRMLQLAAANGFTHEPVREGLVRVSLRLVGAGGPA